MATDELEAVLELWGRARSNAARTRDSAGRLQPLLRSHDSVLLVAVADGAVVGTLIVGWDGWRGSMYRLAVAPEQRRRGVALVGTDDGTAAALWRAVGYELDPGVGRYVRDL